MTTILKPYQIVPFILEKERNGMLLHERNEDADEWRGGITLETAFDRAKNGCVSCANTIKGPIINVIRKQNNYGVQYNLPNDTSGTIVDPGALSTGIPECYVVPEAQKQHMFGDEGIDLVVNTVVSYGVDQKVIRERGIIACVLALMAERMEISTRILISYTAQDRGKGHNDFLIILKDYAQSLDLPMVAFYLISPASSRRIGFSLFDSVDANSNRHGHYYPCNTSYKSFRKKQIVIDHGMYRRDMLSPELAVKTAMDLLRANGIIS